MSYFSFLNPKHWFEDPADTLVKMGTAGLLGADDLPIVGDSRKADRNYQEQKSVQEYQKHLQQQIFDREDSALMRRVEDALASGLSPQLALSQGAGVGSPVSLTTPQKASTPSMLDALSTAIGFKTSLAQLAGQKLSNDIAEYNAEWYKKNNLPTTASGDYVSMLQAIGSLIQGIKGNPDGSVVGQTKGLITNAISKANEQLNAIDVPSDSDINTGFNFGGSNSLDLSTVNGDDSFKSLSSVVKDKWNRFKEGTYSYWNKIKNYRKNRLRGNIFGN